MNLNTLKIVSWTPGLIALGLGLGCAQKLPTEVTRNRPSAAGELLDVNAIYLTDFRSGESVNLGSYMRTRQLNYMLLTFGSRSCVACMEKTEYLEANLVENKQMLGAAAKNFEVKGINVDPANSRQALIDLVDERHLTHLAWSDPQRTAMMTYFQPPGTDFGVPLTVMIKDDRMLWRISSKDHITPEELIKKVSQTLGEDATAVKPPGSVSRPPLTVSPLGILADERADRLNALRIKSCAETEPTTAEVVLGQASLKFILVDRGACAAGSVCDLNRQAVRSLIANHADVSIGEVAVAEKANPEGQSCDASVYSGGAEVFQEFADHFSWTYTAVKNAAGKKVIPPVAGPLTMAFDSNGILVFSKEGAVSAEELQARFSADGFTQRAKGPAFALQSAQGVSDFSTWRQNAKWSVVIFWDTLCASCEEELTQWHRPGNLLSYCNDNPSFCQVMALDRAVFWDNNPSSLPAYIDGVLHGSPDYDGFEAKGWNIPLYVDPFPNQGDDIKRRWFEGWVSARLDDMNRSVLYDREGKVRGTWLAAPGDKGALEMLKAMNKQQEGTP